jgi:TrmH family RNA methyltransferase
VKNMQNKIRIVMVNTSHPGNIGAAARGMKTMGLSELYLVAPRVFPHAEVTARAAGADDVVAKAVVVDSIEAALQDCRLTLGCSARGRHLSLPVLNPRECAQQALEMSAHAPVAIVFGNEQHGLSNAELQRCHFQVCIPSNPAFSSLNVASAIQIIAYEIKMATLDSSATPVSRQAKQKMPALDPQTLPASAEDMALFYAHLETALIAISFMDPSHPRKLMQRLRRFFNRAQPETIELNILRGILAAVLQHSDRGER